MEGKTIAAGVLGLALALGGPAGCAPRSGGACSPIGATQTDDSGQLWTCAKNLNTGKGYWYKGKP